jgi:ATP-dependent HslUV protease subunit HslV
MSPLPAARATTVVAVLRDGALAMASDGQVTLGATVVKQGAQKVRRAAAIGSGAAYALAAARALLRHTKLSASEVAAEALRLAAEICIYTNDRIQVVTLP